VPTPHRLYLILGTVAALLTFKVGLWLFSPDADPGDYAVEGVIGEVQPPEVTLITRGIEPREALRYEPEPGADRRFVMASSDTVQVRAVTENLGDTTFEVRVETRGTIQERLDDGRFRYRWKVKDVEVLRADSSGPLGAPGQRTELLGLKGLRGESLVDPRGLVLRSSLDGGGKGAGKELRQGFARALSEPVLLLPEQEVGERAIWEVRRTEVRNGVDMELVERYELMERKRDRLVLVGTIRGTAPEQTLASFGGDVIQTRLRTFEAKGEGEMTTWLDGGLDSEGRIWTDQDMGLEQDMGGLPITIRLTTRSDLVVERLP
jgi:hypothetical protein